MPGLRHKYSLDIAPGNFVTINDGGGAVTVRALVEGTATAANLFSTSAAIPQNHLVVLEDPEHNFLAGNIVPLVNSRKKSDHLKDVLDAVSAKLTTAAWPSSMQRCPATPGWTPTRPRGNGCGTTVSITQCGSRHHVDLL